jgi:hypothetical protein
MYENNKKLRKKIRLKTVMKKTIKLIINYERNERKVILLLLLKLNYMLL